VKVLKLRFSGALPKVVHFPRIYVNVNRGEVHHAGKCTSYAERDELFTDSTCNTRFVMSCTQKVKQHIVISVISAEEKEKLALVDCKSYC
jgi:hypothetical protein